MATSRYRSRSLGLSEHQEVSVQFAALLSGIPCDGNYYYGSFIPSGLGEGHAWASRTRVTGIRLTATDSNGVLSALGSAYINLKLFNERVGSSSEDNLQRTAIMFEGHNGVAASTDHDQIDTMGQFQDFLVDLTDCQAVHYAISVNGTPSRGITYMVLSMRGNIVY